ncbi:hypothetical protein RclHR1_08080001 [Rhizophagus clarus]|nr:hypothetical protein RclHR1_08080001 [Rhizophagus clarus]
MIPGDESTPKLRNKISKSYMTPGDESTPKLINNISKSYMIFADESMLKLRDNILKSYMIPRNESTPNHNHLDSRLIDRRHIALFKNWIGRKNGKTNYTFNLLYRASRDDNTASAFHAKCDNKGATIIVVKVTNTKQIVGGYNPLFWDSSNSCKSTKYSFIFSFTNKNDLQSANVAYSKGDENSIRSYSHWGPVFGTDLHAAYIPTRDSWRSNVCSYPTLDLPRIFKIDDYEVFQVI